MAAQREQRKAVYGVGTRKELNHGREYRFRKRARFLWLPQARFARYKTVFAFRWAWPQKTQSKKCTPPVFLAANLGLRPPRRRRHVFHGGGSGGGRRWTQWLGHGRRGAWVAGAESSLGKQQRPWGFSWVEARYFVGESIDLEWGFRR
jgi:hypothetical protein